MTHEEAAILVAQTDQPLPLSPHPDPRFVWIRGRCPLLAWEGTMAICTVYPVRPYACRRFGCFRPDPSTEPYEREPVNLAAGRYGCANLSDRFLQSRAVRRAYARMQRKAQRWALRHGWDPAMTGHTTGSDVTIYRLTPTP